MTFDTSEIDPKLARALLEEDWAVSLVSANANRPKGKTKFVVKLGPVLIAEGTKRKRQAALDAVADIICESTDWLTKISNED